MQQYTTQMIDFLKHKRDILANHTLVLIAFFLPIGGRSIDTLYYFLLILYILKKDRPNPFLLIKNNPVILSITLYVGMYYIWILFSNDYSSSFKYATKASFLLYIIVIVSFLKHEFIPRILASFILGVLVSEVISYSLAFGFIEAPFFESQLLASIKNPSPFMYHIHYSFVLAFTAYLLLERIKLNDSIYPRLFAAFFFLTITINLTLNIGRTGYILYILGVLLFIFLNYKKQSYKIIPIVILLLFFVFFAAYKFSPTYQTRVDLTKNSVQKMFFEDQYNTSIGIRIEKNSLINELTVTELFFGHGTGEHLKAAYQMAKEKKMWFASAIKNHPNLDSEYLDTIMQFGFFGLLILLNIFYQTMKYKQTDMYLKRIQITFILFYILFSFANVGIIHHKLSNIFLFFIAITLTQVQSDEKTLDSISYKEFSIYCFFALLLYLRSSFHFGAPIKKVIQTVFN